MAPIIYILQVSLYSAVMWAIYVLVWRNRPLHTFSRIYLLLSLTLPAVLPLIHLPAALGQHPAVTAYAEATTPLVSTFYAQPLPATRTVINWSGLILLLYLAGCIVIAALYARAYLQIFRALRTGRKTNHGSYSIITAASFGPGTIGRSIFFPGATFDNIILQHELAHIKSGHRFDSLFLQVLHVLFWFSPAHWWIGSELKAVHEFEADQIASKGVQAADYAALLLSQTLGSTHSFSISQSFFRKPLKRRIMMLQKMKAPQKSKLLFAAIALTVAFTSTVILANPRKPVKSREPSLNEVAISLIDMEIVKRNTPPPNGEIKSLYGGAIVFKTVDKMPAFNGNLNAWLKAHIQVPAGVSPDAFSKERATIQFTVAEDGQLSKPQILQSSGNQQLDDEAMRVISLMPNWKPGLQNGKPVPVMSTLSISFNGNEGC